MQLCPQPETVKNKQPDLFPEACSRDCGVAEPTPNPTPKEEKEAGALFFTGMSLACR